MGLGDLCVARSWKTNLWIRFRHGTEKEIACFLRMILPGWRLDFLLMITAWTYETCLYIGLFVGCLILIPEHLVVQGGLRVGCFPTAHFVTLLPGRITRIRIHVLHCFIPNLKMTME